MLSRLALVSALTVGLLALTGAISGAASFDPAVKLAGLVKLAVTSPSNNSSGRPTSTRLTAASDQFGLTVCHHATDNPGGARTLRVSSQAAVDAYVLHHAGDHPGACGPGDLSPKK
jgi:hypothetical protein